MLKYPAILKKLCFCLLVATPLSAHEPFGDDPLEFPVFAPVQHDADPVDLAQNPDEAEGFWHLFYEALQEVTENPTLEGHALDLDDGVDDAVNFIEQLPESMFGILYWLGYL